MEDFAIRRNGCFVVSFIRSVTLSALLSFAKNVALLGGIVMVAEKVSKLELAGEEYGLSKNSVARLIRVDKLIPELKEVFEYSHPVRLCCRSVSRRSDTGSHYFDAGNVEAGISW